MTDRLKEAIEQALSFQRMCIERDSESLAHATLVDPAGQVVLMAFANDCMESWQNKNMAARHILGEMFKTDSVSAFVSDAWAVKLEKGMDRSKMPKNFGDWPAHLRSEFLIACGNEIGYKGVFVRQCYKRTADKVIFEPIQWELGAAGGRFIFDLTERSLEKALRQSINCGSEGHGTAN